MYGNFGLKEWSEILHKGNMHPKLRDFWKKDNVVKSLVTFEYIKYHPGGHTLMIKLPNIKRSQLSLSLEQNDYKTIRLKIDNEEYSTNISNNEHVVHAVFEDEVLYIDIEYVHPLPVPIKIY